jgi:hypothetical protein
LCCARLGGEERYMKIKIGWPRVCIVFFGHSVKWKEKEICGMQSATIRIVTLHVKVATRNKCVEVGQHQENSWHLPEP